MLEKNGVYVSVEMSRKDRAEDLDFLVQLVSEGKLKTVIDRTYPFEEIAEAHGYAEKKHKKGNVVIQIQ